MNILIDDDKYIRLSWQLKSKKDGVDFCGFDSIYDFLQKYQNFVLESNIYIDSNLGRGIKGEIESKKIADLGFKNIYLTTGYSDLDISNYPWIKKLVLKECPF